MQRTYLSFRSKKKKQSKMFPKVYKLGNPSRPVVSSVDCHTTQISK